MTQWPSLNANEQGFTLPELISSLIITSLFVAVIMSFMFGYWKYSALLEADLDTLVTRLNAGDVLRDLIGTSAGLVTQNSIADSHTNNPDPANASNNYWLPIHAIPGSTSIGAGGTTTPLVYFRRFSTNTSGAYIMNGTLPYEDEYVLYLNGTTKQLLLRSLANPSASGNRLKTSCPSNVATASCPADRIIASDLASVSMRYFSRTGNTIDWTSVYDSNTNSYAGPDFTAVEVVEFTVNLNKKPFLQQSSTATQNSTVIRIALRNA